MENVLQDTNLRYHVFVKAIFAIEKDDITQLNMLLEKHPYIVGMLDDYGKTLLHKAIDSGSQTAKMVSILLSAGSKVSVLDYNNETPLHLAVSYKSAEVQNLLLDEADLCLKAFWKKPLLHAAVQSQNVSVQIVKRMIYNGLRGQINFRGTFRNPSLHRAVSNLYVFPELVELLINEGADVNMLGFNGLTPLHCALANINCQYSVIETLLKMGANIQALERKYKPPICTAINNDNVSQEIIIMLIQYGALPKHNAEAQSFLNTLFQWPMQVDARNKNILTIMKHLALTVPNFSVCDYKCFNYIFDLVREIKTESLFNMSVYEYIQNGYMQRTDSENQLSEGDKRNTDILLQVVASKRCDFFNDVIEHNIRRKELVYIISDLGPCLVETPSKLIDISPVVVSLTDYITQKTDLLNFCLAFYFDDHYKTSSDFSGIKRKKRKWVKECDDFV